MRREWRARSNSAPATSYRLIQWKFAKPPGGFLHGSRPQAIFAASNIAAKGVIPAIQALGLRIPEDIALLVMDDFEALSLLNPGISVVAQPSRLIAEVGWRMLRQSIADQELEAQHVRLPAKLIVRGSTPPVAKDRKRR